MVFDRKVASFVSKLTFPLVFLPLGAIIFLWLRLGSEAFYWIFLGLFLGLIPVGLSAALMRKKKEKDIHDRDDRNLIYVIASISAVAMTFISYSVNAPSTVISLSLVLSVTTAVFTVLNQLVKISIHTGSTAALTGLFTTLNVPAGLFLGALTILVGFSRVKLNRHSSKEVLLGFIVGLIAGLTAFIF